MGSAAMGRLAVRSVACLQADARAYRNEQVAYAEAAQRLEHHLDREC